MSRNQTVMVTLWKSLIPRILDYCSQLWYPHLKKDINRLEYVQRNFTSKINGMEGLNYRQRLASLKMCSQERRRDRYMVIFIWKISMGLVEGYSMDFSQSNNRRGRECSVKTVVNTSPASVKRTRENSLAVKGAKMFNMLPSHIRNVTSEKVDVSWTPS